MAGSAGARSWARVLALSGLAWILNAVVCQGASGAAPAPAAGFTAEDWRQIRESYFHEAELFGRNDAGRTGANLGYSVSVSGDTLVIGAPFEDNGLGAAAGAVYVFVRSGAAWALEQRLAMLDGLPGDLFGYSVSVSGDVAVVGARGDDTAGTDAGAAHVFVRSGAVWTEEQKLTASDAAVSDQFGYSVSLSGDTVLVGAYSHDSPSQMDVGAAYVFVRSGTAWTEQQELTASDGMLHDYFGISVSLSGDTAVVGAYFDTTAAGSLTGSAYVFVRSGSTWTEQQKLIASDAQTSAGFGVSVSVSADTLVVGSYLHDTGAGMDAGSAYVFVRSGNTWTEQQKLTASDGQAFAVLGASVAISGDTLIAGAYLDDTPAGGDAGSAYVFVRSGTTWTEQQKLTASDAAPVDVFGFSVALSGDTVVVGAEAADTTAGVDAGAAYAFVRSGSVWSEQQKLPPADVMTDDAFGDAVAISGHPVGVGAAHDDSGALGQGSAYVFVRSAGIWTQQQKLLAWDGSSQDWFGFSVAISGDTVVVAAELDDTAGGHDAGSAYVFVRSGTTWSEQQKLLAPDGAMDDIFGHSVSLSGDTALVGAYLDDNAAGVGAGSAYVFVRTGTNWTVQQKLLAPDGADNDLFGASVSISVDTAVVGAVLDDNVGGVDAGAAYVFVRSGFVWTQQQKVVPVEAAPGDFFGGSVSVSEDALAVGALGDDSPAGVDAGGAWTFTRSGTSWIQAPELFAPDGSLGDAFGSSVAATEARIVVGAPRDTTPAASFAGSTHVFSVEPSDLYVGKTDGLATVVAGQPLTYTITVGNGGPGPAVGATVTDVVPSALHGVSWTCAASPGATCSPSGTGSIADTVSLLVGSSVVYTLTGTLDAGATGTLLNTATVTPGGGGSDPIPVNNTSPDLDTITAEGDLSVAKSDGQAAAIPGGLITYSIAVANAGPSHVTSAIVTDVLPAALLGATWGCVATGGSTCSASGSGSISDGVSLLSGGALTYTLTATVDPAATGTLVNTAGVAIGGNATDPDPANNSATDIDTFLPAGLPGAGELVHGYRRQHDLAALPGPVAHQDLFRLRQRGHASYEVLLDGASGDLGSGSGPFLERLGTDASTVVQSSLPAGAGGSRSLRWRNPYSASVSDEFVRVRSGGCSTDCDAADVYRLSMWETTGFVPRFNNSGTQVTVLVVQNVGDEPIEIDMRFWSSSGAELFGIQYWPLAPKATYVLNTSGFLPEASGSITVAHTGHYGQLAGKAVAVEPATGFTFDTALQERPR